MRKFAISLDTVTARPYPRLQACTPELLTQSMELPRVGLLCEQLAQAYADMKAGRMKPRLYKDRKAQLKRQLPFMCPMAWFGNGKRTLRDEQGQPNAVPSGLAMIDVDDVEDPRALYEETVKPHLQELGTGMVHVTPSGHGLRVIFRYGQGMPLTEAIGHAARLLSIDPQRGGIDKACKDLTRASYLVPEQYVLYRSDEVLFGNAGATLFAPQRVETHPAVVKEESQTCPRSYKGIAYQDIIDAWMELDGGMPVEGERNTRLFKLASELRYITDDNEDTLYEVMPHCGLGEQEMRAIIRSACRDSYRHGVPAMMRKAVAMAKSKKYGLKINDDNENENEQPPQMPAELPRLIKLLVSRTPDIYKPTVAQAVFPSLAAHMYNCKFMYIDGELHEPTLMNVLMAETGAGKSCIAKPIDYIMADIRERDRQNMEREQAWKDQVNKLGANKDKPLRPQQLIVQEIDPDMTNPAFVMRMKEAQGHFLYSRLNEIEQFDALKGNNKSGQQFQIMCLCFDPDNLYGQTRVSVQSVTAKVHLLWNWNASTTVSKGRRYFSRVLTDGPISRINFCTIPQREIGAEMPVYKPYGDDFASELKPYIDNLCSHSGEIDVPQARDLIRQLHRETSDMAQLTQSRVYENLSFRALVIAYLKACVLYVANGLEWEESMDEFIRWSLNYDLWCKMEFFGDDIAAAEQGLSQPHHGPRNLLSLLPAQFTTEQAQMLRQQRGMTGRGTVQMLSQWKHRGYIINTKSGWAKC